jgi:hypothetical protein
MFKNCVDFSETSWKQTTYKTGKKIWKNDKMV